MPELPTGTVTFLFTDIEESTRLWEEHPEAMKGTLARHDGILRSAIESNEGYVFTTAGDAFSAAFTSPRAAAQAALTAQQQLTTEEWDEPGPVKVRMAIHTGTAEERDGDYFGPALNRCARLLAAGHGGQVLVSLATEEVAGHDLPEQATLNDLGEHRLKDLGRPERVFQLTHPDLPDEFAPLQSLDAFVHNLPLQLTSFVGRSQELRELSKLLEDARLVTLTGVGGCGKTRLALQAAAERIEDFPDGVWLVELAPVGDATLLPQTVATALGVSTGGAMSGGGGETLEALKTYLARRELLLIFDNCEHLLDAAARLADRLLKSAVGVRVLATSREGLGIAGERLWQVPSLDTGDEWAEAVTWEEASEWEAVRLYFERATDYQPAFDLTQETVPVVARICRRLDGLPLAIELAAARMKLLNVDQIAERLDDRFRLLTGGSRTALPRQQTLLATVEWSYDLLSDKEKLLFGRLAAFRAGFTLEAAEAVCSGDALDAFQVLDLLGQLVDKSLVIVEADPHGPDRYRMLETLRQFSLERLADREEADSIRRQHAGYFLAFAENAAPKLDGPEMIPWMDRLELEHDNFRAALTWCLEADQPLMALRYTVALSFWFWEIHRHHEEAFGWHERTLAAAQDAPPELLGRALVYAGDHAFWLTNERALDLATRGRDLCRATGDARGEMVAEVLLGLLAQQRYERDEAIKHFEATIEVARRADDLLFDCWGRFFIANRLRDRGDLAAAKAWNDEALDLARQTGQPLALGACGSLAGEIALNEGDLEVAFTRASEALGLVEQLGDWNGIDIQLGTLGWIARLRGDLDQARQLQEQRIALIRRWRDPLLTVYPLAELTLAHLERGNSEEAAVTARESLLQIRGTPWKVMTSLSLEAGAATLAESNAPAVAIQLFATAERLRAEADTAAESWDRAQCEQYLTEARQQLGEEAFAEAWASGASLDPTEAVDLALEQLAAARSEALNQ